MPEAYAPRARREERPIHVICGRIVEYGVLLRCIGEMDSPYRTGRSTARGMPDRRITATPVGDQA